MAESSTALLDRVKELSGAKAHLVEQQQAIIDSTELKDGVLVGLDDTKISTFHENQRQIKLISDFVTNTETLLGIKEGKATPANEPVGPAAAAAAAGGPNAAFGYGGLIVPRKSIGQMFLDSEEFKSLGGGRNGLTMRTPAAFAVEDLPGHYRGAKDIYSHLPTAGGPSQFGIIQRDPTVTLQMRTGRVRDLFPIQQTNAAIIQYFRQTGFVNNASPVAERNTGNTDFAAKPHSTISFAGETATIRTIAHWEAAHRNVLDDEPQLRGIIDTELLYGLQLVEDAQILSGTGTGEDLPGILNDTGIQTYTQGANGHTTDNKADALRRAMTLITLAYYEPTGIVVHDRDWEDIELTKNTQGTYLLAVQVAIGAEARLWRVPVVQSPAMPQGRALVGAFGLGAQLYDRSDATIRVAEQHADFFIKNAIVVLAEERLGLAVKRPESFVEVTFT